MYTYHDKLTDATVEAGFYTQSEADDALLGLRSVGFRDSQIGYYAQLGNGLMRDFLGRFDRFGAALLWGLIGVGGGIVVAWMVNLSGFDQDPGGIDLTCGVIGALIVGSIGGFAGLHRPRRGTLIAISKGMTEPFVMAVNAGSAGRNEAMAILRQHGGHEMHLEGYIALA